MKRIITSCIIVMALVTIYFGLSVQAQPPYAKWGKIAVEKTKEKYPKAQIIDYLHIGRKPKTVYVSIEKFKLWLREGGKEFGVFVDIEFDTKTEKFLKIIFRETDR